MKTYSTFEKIETDGDIELNDLLKKIKRHTVQIKEPKNKEEAKALHDFYVALRDYYGDQMKTINRSIMPNLRKMIK